MIPIRRLVALTAAITLAGPLSVQVGARAQSAAERAAETRALAVIEALGSGDAEAAWSALQEHLRPSTLERRPEASWRRLVERLVGDLRGVGVEGVAIDGSTLRIRASAQGHDMTFSFEVEAEPPHRLGGFGVELGDGSAASGPGPELTADMDRPTVARTIDDFVKRHVAANGFSGTVLVARDGEAWHRSAHGLAHRGYGVANHLGTRFNLGSINKLFTQVAIAQLVAEGNLSLDDTVAELLPDYPNRAVAERITVRHLARHTSGLGDIFVPAYFEAAKTRFRQPEDFFPLFADQDLLFEPGEGRQYSNAGFQVLGAIVAAVTGEPYHDVIAERVWATAGMTATAFVARDEPTPEVAVGYTTRSEDGRLRNNLFRLPVIGSPAGSSFSTVDDLLRFDRALRGGTLLDPVWAAWVLTGEEPAPGAATPDLENLGLGLAGGAPGVNAMYLINGPWTVIVLANQDPPAAGRLAEPVSRALRSLGPSPRPSAAGRGRPRPASPARDGDRGR